MKIRFYFVRHGETLFNKRGRVSGVSDSPLTKLGVVQAKRAGAALHSVWFDKAFVSPAERCINTAGYILEDQEAEAEIIEDLHDTLMNRIEINRTAGRGYYELYIGRHMLTLKYLCRSPKILETTVCA